MKLTRVFLQTGEIVSIENITYLNYSDSADLYTFTSDTSGLGVPKSGLKYFTTEDIKEEKEVE